MDTTVRKKEPSLSSKNQNSAAYLGDVPCGPSGSIFLHFQPVLGKIDQIVGVHFLGDWRRL